MREQNPDTTVAERQRLLAHRQRRANWKQWGPYLSERAWGTVREDYSVDGDPWAYFSHDHARSRAYRWNEDGLAGISELVWRIVLVGTLILIGAFGLFEWELIGGANTAKARSVAVSVVVVVEMFYLFNCRSLNHSTLCIDLLSNP
jgi:hypothetical protein